LAFLGLAAFGFTAFFGLAAGFFLGLTTVIYTNCPSERYNQIVRRTVYIVEIVLESKNGRYISKEEGYSQA
jgi:hypothetical protein